jgi:hypothetical protein
MVVILPAFSVVILTVMRVQLVMFALVAIQDFPLFLPPHRQMRHAFSVMLQAAINVALLTFALAVQMEPLIQ